MVNLASQSSCIRLGGLIDGFVNSHGVAFKLYFTKTSFSARRRANIAALPSPSQHDVVGIVGIFSIHAWWICPDESLDTAATNDYFLVDFPFVLFREDLAFFLFHILNFLYSTLFFYSVFYSSDHLHNSMIVAGTRVKSYSFSISTFSSCLDCTLSSVRYSSNMVDDNKKELYILVF